MKRAFLFILFFSSLTVFAQTDLLKMLDSVSTKKDKIVNRVTATFKTTRLINLITPQTVGAGELDFRITHRFGNIGAGSSGGFHTLYGLDGAADIRFAFDYGLTRTLQLGVGRSKRAENIDGSMKWRFMEQTLDNRVPFTMCVYSIVALTPVRQSLLYSGADQKWIDANKRFAHRFSYVSQLVIARKFGSWLSLEVAPTYTHRNYVLNNINSSNKYTEENDLFSLGGGFRIRISRSFSIITDYYYTISMFRKDNTSILYYNPLAIGFELETGGHVFHMDFTNATGIIENSYIPYSPDSWGKGGFKFGFNISRVFQISHRAAKDWK